MENNRLLVSLCAGTGSRLSPLTDDTHKSMISVAGCPILKKQIDLFSDLVVDNIVVGGYLSETLYLGNGRLIVNPDYQTTNMVYSLMCARDDYEAYDEIIISYGVYNSSYLELSKILTLLTNVSIPTSSSSVTYWFDCSYL